MQRADDPDHGLKLPPEPARHRGGLGQLAAIVGVAGVEQLTDQLVAAAEMRIEAGRFHADRVGDVAHRDGIDAMFERTGAWLRV